MAELVPGRVSDVSTSTSTSTDTAGRSTDVTDIVDEVVPGVPVVPTDADGHPVPSDAPDDAAVVAVHGLSKSFGEQSVLRGLDLTMHRNEFVALLGRSGEGKSTFLRILEGLDTDFGGDVGVAARRAVVFQEPRLLPWAPVWRNVVLGLPLRGAAAREVAERALAEVGLTAKADAWPLTLSGGEAQRVGLARALVREPDLLLLDEPFGALDALTRLRMHTQLRDLIARHGPGVILVTHDVQEALDLASRITVVADGHIVLDEPVVLPGRDRDPDRIEDLRRRILTTLGVEIPA